MSPSDQEEQRVYVQTVWPHEALDFTPWLDFTPCLAQNLDQVGAELGLRLDLIGARALGRAASCRVVGF